MRATLVVFGHAGFYCILSVVGWQPSIYYRFIVAIGCAIWKILGYMRVNVSHSFYLGFGTLIEQGRSFSARLMLGLFTLTIEQIGQKRKSMAVVNTMTVAAGGY